MVLCGSMGCSSVQVLGSVVLFVLVVFGSCEFGESYVVMLFGLCSSYDVGLCVVWCGAMWCVLLCFFSGHVHLLPGD